MPVPIRMVLFLFVGIVLFLLYSYVVSKSATITHTKARSFYKSPGCNLTKLEMPIRLHADTIRLQSSMNFVPYKIFSDDPAKDKVSAQLGQEWPWESWMVSYYTREIKSAHFHKKGPRIFMDVGSHIGSHTFPMAVLGHYVHSFEPFRRSYDLLSCSAEANDFPNMKVNNLGLSDKNFKGCVIPNGQESTSARYRVNATCEEPTQFITLDEYWQNELDSQWVFSIKVDVEGHEASIFRGARSMLKQKPPAYIYLEIYPLFITEYGDKVDDFLNQMLDSGYSIMMLHNFQPVTKTNGAVQVITDATYSLYLRLAHDQSVAAYSKGCL